jgi:hypothetical protein
MPKSRTRTSRAPSRANHRRQIRHGRFRRRIQTGSARPAQRAWPTSFLPRPTPAAPVDHTRSAGSVFTSRPGSILASVEGHQPIVVITVRIADISLDESVRHGTQIGQPPLKLYRSEAVTQC